MFVPRVTLYKDHALVETWPNHVVRVEIDKIAHGAKVYEDAVRLAKESDRAAHADRGWGF
jgi:hypothetical protein